MGMPCGGLRTGRWRFSPAPRPLSPTGMTNFRPGPFAATVRSASDPGSRTHSRPDKVESPTRRTAKPVGQTGVQSVQSFSGI